MESTDWAALMAGEWDGMGWDGMKAPISIYHREYSTFMTRQSRKNDDMIKQ